MTSLSVSALVLITCATGTLGAQVPAGWKTVKDRTGVCQMSVPSSWTVNASAPGTASGPDNMSARVLHGLDGAMHALTEEDQRTAAPIDTLFENTAQRHFWLNKPVAPSAGQPMLVFYQVEAAGQGHRCVAQFSAKPGHSDEIKKLAATVRPVT